jgi:hypothetical protein
VASDDTDTKEKLNSWDFSNSIKFGNVTVWVALSQAYISNIEVYAELVVLIESE